MFLANVAALRSIDLSRQVGASILNDQGQIVCLGANEVPKAFGGTYWADGKFDDRDYCRGYDSNDKRKREILAEVLKLLDRNEKIDDLLISAKIKDSQLMDALEYGRVVHAEMNAICDAARNGVSVRGACLYTTTFPCHMCAKHIIAAGISDVVFLEPYPKSLASELHSDALEIEGGDRGSYAGFPAVKFLHFYGVTPRRYRELFERGERKNDSGEFVSYSGGVAAPLLDIKTPFYSQPEGSVLAAIKKKFLKKLNIDHTVLDR